MRIGEIAEKTGLSISNIRFYEKKGLIGPDREKESKYRNYTEEDLERLKQIVLLRKMDFPIEVISNILGKRITIEDAIEQQLTELENKKNAIQGSIDLCNKIVSYGECTSHDIDYYLRYVKDEERKGKVFGKIEVFIDEVLDYCDYCFGNTPFAWWLMPRTKSRNVMVLLMLALMIGLTIVAVVEDLLEGNNVSLGTIILCVIWWGIMIYSLVGYWKYITVRKKIYGEDKFH